MGFFRQNSHTDNKPQPESDSLQSALDEAINEERRTAPRSAQENFFVKTVHSSQVTSVGDEFKTGSTVNISATGMQVTLDYEVLADSEIALWIHSDDPTDKILLDGIIRWTTNLGEYKGYSAGIELTTESAKTLNDWMKKNEAH